MTSIPLSIKVVGIEALTRKLGKDTVENPLTKNIKTIGLKLEELVKKGTVVDTGRLRSSIASEIQPLWAKVGTAVEYAEFVEWGTGKMAARHMVGGTKVLGQGMFAYGLEKLLNWIGQGEKDIAKDIEVEFEKR